jgi:hypothetical protein
VTLHPLTAACDRSYTAHYVDGTRPLSRILWLVLHDTEGDTAQGAASWFQNPASQGAAHFCIDANHCYRTCDPQTIAYAAFSPGNERGLHFEQAGYAAWSRSQWLTLGRGTIERTAYRVAYWAKALGIVLSWLSDAQVKGQSVHGVTTHAQLTKCFPGPNVNHTDPGPNYPRDVFMAQARKYRAAL